MNVLHVPVSDEWLVELVIRQLKTTIPYEGLDP